jgi:hypothetical protein
MKNKLIKFILNAEAKWPPAYKYLVGALLTPFIFLVIPIFIVGVVGFTMWELIVDSTKNAKDKI